MTDEERCAWDARCYRYWPEQAHGHGEWIASFIGSTVPRDYVMEVGGWRGDHAASMLKTFPELRGWTNFEFCDEAVKNPKCVDPRYRAMVPHRFRWWEDMRLPEAPMLVLSHVIEHLSPEDLKGLVGAAAGIPNIYVEAPLPSVGTEWMGYLGTHVLPWTFREVDDLFTTAGYRTQQNYPEARVYRRKDV